MQAKKIILIIALVAVLATASVVAADEAGIITINILNNPNSQLNTEISNSTIQGQTNYTNSNAQENVTLTNSTLTLNVNGQNITIASQDDNLVITTPNQTTTSTNPNSIPLLSIAFLESSPSQHQIISGNATYQYDFNVTVGVPTSINFPFGRNVTHEALAKVLLPLAPKYDLATYTTIEPGSNSTVTKVTALSTQVVGGENVFSLFSNSNLSTQQIDSLTSDLYNAFSLAMGGNS